MKIPALILAFACIGCSSPGTRLSEASSANVEPGGNIPQIFKVKEFNCLNLADAVNHYIALGEASAITELKALEEDLGESMDRGFSRNERIGWICRIVFQGSKGKPLRQPLYGGLGLPYMSMPLERWPLYPVAESEGVFFVLSEGYMLAGAAEPAKDYIDYCSANGEFRKTKIKKPTHQEAVSAFDSLKKSRQWAMIKWKDEHHGTTYTMSEEWVLRYIEAQLNFIK